MVSSDIFAASTDISAVGNFQRGVHELSDGSTLVFVTDGTGARLFQSFDHVNWIQRATFSTLFGAFSTYSSAIGADDSFHLVFRNGSGNFKYVKATCNQAVPSWTVGSQENITAGTDISMCDIDILDVNGIAGTPLVVGMNVASPATAKLWVRRLSDGAWANFRDIKVATTAHGGPQGVSLARGVGNVDLSAKTATYAVTVLAPNISFYTGDVISAGAVVNYQTGVSVSFGTSITNLYAGTDKSLVRSYQLFSVGTGIWDLVVAVGNGFLDARVGRLDKDGWRVNLKAVDFPLGLPVDRSDDGSYNSIACAHNGESIVILYKGKRNNILHTCNIHARISDIGVTWIPPNSQNVGANLTRGNTTGDWWDLIPGVYDHDTDIKHLIGGNNRNFSTVSGKRVGIVSVLANSWDWRYNYNVVRTYPQPSSPANHSTVTTNLPTLKAQVVNGQLQQGRMKVVWQIARDAGFTTSVKNIFQSDAEYGVVYRTGTSTWSKTIDADNALYQGTWYVRTAAIDPWGFRADFSAAKSFTILHPPSAIVQSPVKGDDFDYGAAGLITVTWKFTSTWKSSYQTAYRVLVESNPTDGSASATVVDTGKMQSDLFSTLVQIPEAYKGVPLRWRVKVWDEDDVSGAYSSYGTFFVVDASTITITTPGDIVTISNPTPDINWLFFAPGDEPDAPVADESNIPFLFADAFKTPIIANPTPGSNNDVLVPILAAGTKLLNTGLYGVPVHEADFDTPRWTVGSTTAPLTIRSLGFAAPIRSHAYALNYPVVTGGYAYKVTTAGITAGSAPTFPTTYGATVTDGTVVWRNVGAASGTALGDNDLAYQSICIPDTLPGTLGADKHVVVIDSSTGMAYCLYQPDPTVTGYGISGGTSLVSQTFTGTGAWPAGWTQGNIGSGNVGDVVSAQGRLRTTQQGTGNNITESPNAVNALNVDTLIDSTTPAGTEFAIQVYVRANAQLSQTSCYYFELRNGAVNLYRQNAGAITQLASCVGPANGVACKIRVRADGNKLRLKWWTGGTEPYSWNLRKTDNALTDPGYVIVGHTGGSGGTPVTSDWLINSIVVVQDSVEAAGTVTGWTVTWGGVYPLTSDGTSPQPDYVHYVGTGPVSRSLGSGVAANLGLLSIEDLKAGKVNHALSFGTNVSKGPFNTGPFRYPATTTDATGANDSSHLPEGARIQLDPTLDLTTIYGISPLELMIGQALQKYGAYCVDAMTNATLSFLAEPPTTTADKAVTDSFGIYGDTMDLSHIPWDSITVLATWNT